MTVQNTTYTSTAFINKAAILHYFVVQVVASYNMHVRSKL